ncbi:MAG: MCE family protein [Actinomycetota bacterium]|nr:MCE family protein [Actinomycetota bacterium]
MSRRRTLLRLVAIVASAMVVLSGCSSIYEVPLPGGASVGNNPITVHVEFRDVLDLVPQSTVKVNDVTVGKVKAIDLKGYTADVTLLLPNNLNLPDNARAEIRQTSLLGEKFVSLSPPVSGASSGRLSNGDVIPLARTNRNPEVEEVLGALSLLLNGGGVGQLKTIAAELNTTFGGRESDVRSVLDQLRAFMGQLAANKVQIVQSIEALNRLALQLKQQDGSIKLALDDLPAALKSINGQRTDLVRMLHALSRLSGIGVKVITASKTSTINSLRDLAPVLGQLAAAGQDFPNSLHVLLTYPFIDEAVGRNPQVARNLHLGDYTNLSARLNISLTTLPLPVPSPPAVKLPPLLVNACKLVKQQVTSAANTAVANLPLSKQNKQKVRDAIVKQVMASIDCNNPGNIPAKVAAALVKILKSNLPGLPKIPLPTNIPGLPKLPGGLGAGGGLGLGRAGTSFDNSSRDVFNGPAGGVDKLGYNSTLGSLLLQGVSG